MAVNPIPEGYHSVTPYLVAKDARGLLTFILEAFGAQERMITEAVDKGWGKQDFSTVTHVVESRIGRSLSG